VELETEIEAISLSFNFGLSSFFAMFTINPLCQVEAKHTTSFNLAIVAKLASIAMFKIFKLETNNFKKL